MAILNKLISAAVMTIVLTGCYSDFEPDIDSTPVVCINANAKVGEVLKIFATRTWRWTEINQDEGADIQLKDGEVSLYVNDELFEVLHYSEWDYHDPKYSWVNKQCGLYFPYSY